MRWLKVAVPLTVLGIVAAQVARAEVPVFARQTGLTCNQCHVGIDPNPDHTFTGVKFRLNGYRTPWISERLEAGEEGAVNGRRLMLGLENRLAFHVRSQLLAQSKGSSDPRSAEPAAGAIETQPYQSLAWQYVGPVTENLGVWNEFYNTQASTPGNQNGLMRTSAYQVNLAFNPGDGGNILGLMFSNEGHINQFGSQLTGASNNQKRRGQAESVHLAAYGWFRDRVALMIGVEPGEDNLNYRRMNYVGTMMLWGLNTDALWLGVMIAAKAGNDMVPLVTNMVTAVPFGTASQAREAVVGVRATRAGGQPYASINTGDAKRLLIDARLGFVDRGDHSLTSSWAIAIEDETYDDGAMTKHTAIGAQVRYYYKRTHGFRILAGTKLKYEFTDQSGRVHDIPQDVNFDALYAFRQAMNFTWVLQYSNSQASVLDQNFRNGWNWILRWHYLW